MKTKNLFSLSTSLLFLVFFLTLHPVPANIPAGNYPLVAKSNGVIIKAQVKQFHKVGSGVGQNAIQNYLKLNDWVYLAIRYDMPAQHKDDFYMGGTQYVDQVYYAYLVTAGNIPGADIIVDPDGDRTNVYESWWNFYLPQYSNEQFWGPNSQFVLNYVSVSLYDENYIIPEDNDGYRPLLPQFSKFTLTGVPIDNVHLSLMLSDPQNPWRNFNDVWCKVKEIIVF